MRRDVIQGSFRAGGAQSRRLIAPPPAHRPPGPIQRSAVASRPVRPAIAPPPGAAALIQRHTNGIAFQAPSTLSITGRGGGQSLPGPIRQQMESALGADLSDVRVHVGLEAAAIGALAFTHGSNLYFAPGCYDPHTPRGQQLLGHELAHVLQQRAGRVRNPFASGVVVVQDPVLEAEADRMGKRAAASRSTRVQAFMSVPEARRTPHRPTSPGGTAQTCGSATVWGPASRERVRRPAIPFPSVQRMSNRSTGNGVPGAAHWKGRRSGTLGVARNVIQPLIVVAPGQSNQTDYALVKVALQLWKRQTGTGSYAKMKSLNQSTDFSGMAQGESLYIVGHGVQDTGQIKGVDANTLIGWLNNPNTGIPANIGEIAILTCYAGIPYGGESLAQKIAQGLRHRGIPVHGAQGYTYGSTTTQTHGRNRVLPPPFEDNVYTEFYKGNDVAKMLTFLRGKTATAPLVLTLENGTRKTVPAGQTWGQRLTDEEIRSWVRRFISERDRIEGRMRDIVSSTTGGYLSVRVRNLVGNQEFANLVTEQEQLFDEGELFRAAGTGYVTHVS